MAAKIISFEPAHFSFEERGGYNIIPADIIGDFFHYLRGLGPDAFIIKRYSSSEKRGTEIMRGCIPTEAIDLKSIKNAQDALEKALDEQAEKARKRIGSSIANTYQSRVNGNNLVYVTCNDGIMGCGWYDNAHTKHKGLTMAAFMLYALGSINSTKDAKLLTAVYHYLPFDGPFTQRQADNASDIIVRAITAKVVKKNDNPFNIFATVPD